MTKPNLTLTIAGNDASGGAGIAADLKTFAEYGTYGIAALTTISNTLLFPVLRSVPVLLSQAGFHSACPFRDDV